MGLPERGRLESLLTSTSALLVYAGAADFFAHLAFADNYGYFRDELYYIVSGTQHLSLSYVDFPPLTAWVAALLNPLTGDSLFSIHVVPALVEAALVVVAGLIARELGGGRKAQLLAAVTTLLTLTFLADGSEFSPDSFDQLWWSVLAYVVVRLVRRREPRLWVAVGVVVGVGLLSKLTMFFFAGALLVCFLAAPSCRGYLRSRWLAVGALITLLLVLPIVYWNAVNGWPTVGFYSEFRGDFGGGGPLSFLSAQLAEMNYFNVPLFLFGLWFFVRSEEGHGLRAIGLAYILLFALMSLLSMKPYYLSPAYPVLFAGGAIAVERSAASKKGLPKWFGSRPWVAATVLLAVLLAPLIIPVLPPTALVSTYGESTLQGVNGGVASGETGPLPQNLGDRLGWGAMVASLAKVYDGLPVAERDQACIFTSNYGEASAVNFLGRGMGLPPAISGHNNYFVWGPGSCSGQVIITVGESLAAVQASYANSTLVTTLTCMYCMDLENNVPVVVGTHPTFTSLSAEWAAVKSYG